MKKTALRKPNSSTFGGMRAPKIGFSVIANTTARPIRAAMGTSGARILAPGPRDRTARSITIAKRVAATPSFQEAMTVVALMLVRNTPKKKAIVTAWNGRIQRKSTIGRAARAPTRALEPESVAAVVLIPTPSLGPAPGPIFSYSNGAKRGV